MQSSQHESPWADPRYVQVTKSEAARILGRSVPEFDRLRRVDPRCPAGHKQTDARSAMVRFRLSDIYAYSDALMTQAE